MIHFASWTEAVFALVLLLPFLFFAGCAFYLLRLAAYAAGRRGAVVPLRPTEAGDKAAGRTESDAGRKRFVVLIPAHNESLVLGAALDSLNQLDYPADAYRLVVIADNCADDTAAIATKRGARALIRFNDAEIGKGFALEWALQELGIGGEAKIAPFADFDFEAVVILDADTQVSPNLLTAFEAGLNAGKGAMQVRYEVLNAGESWRTRLMSCALALAHIVKPLGREQLRLSDGLKGNGMCFTRPVIEEVAWSGASITEDIEYTLRLCRAGVRISFVPEAAVWAQMPTTGAQSVSQRKRWEGGRYQLLTKVAPQLLLESFRKRDRILRDRAIELIIPPFAEMFALPILLLCLSAGFAFITGWRSAQWYAAGWLIILFLQAVYLFGGLWVARVPIRVALSIFAAPVYIVWKIGVYGVMAVSRSAGGWKRTERREL